MNTLLSLQPGDQLLVSNRSGTEPLHIHLSDTAMAPELKRALSKIDSQRSTIKEMADQLQNQKQLGWEAKQQAVSLAETLKQNGIALDIAHVELRALRQRYASAQDQLARTTSEMISLQNAQRPVTATEILNRPWKFKEPESAPIGRMLQEALAELEFAKRQAEQQRAIADDLRNDRSALHTKLNKQGDELKRAEAGRDAAYENLAKANGKLADIQGILNSQSICNSTPFSRAIRAVLKANPNQSEPAK